VAETEPSPGCGHEDCTGQPAGEHPEEMVIAGKAVKTSVSWRSEPPADFLQTNAGVTYRDH
jgi:hypothetical protein